MPLSYLRGIFRLKICPKSALCSSTIICNDAVIKFEPHFGSIEVCHLNG